jgi:DNA-binding GntR family transcriptional regulator
MSSPAVEPAAQAQAHEGDEAWLQKQLTDAIYEHRIPPGTKLPEIDLCNIYGVSRGVIRKVLSKLAAEQLVDLFPNRGAFVARPSVELTRDVYALRRILESGVVRCLAHRANDSWLPSVREQVAQEREANRVGDTGQYIRLAGKFHLDLAAATGNAALEQHLRRLVSQTSLMVALYEYPGTNTCSVLEHLEILDAIQARDFARAEKLMDEHLLGCERQLRLDGDVAPTIDLASALRAQAQAGATGDGRAAPKVPSRASVAVTRARAPAKAKPQLDAAKR